MLNGDTPGHPMVQIDAHDNVKYTTALINGAMHSITMIMGFIDEIK